MRFYRKATIVISEDDSTTPKDIRYKTEDVETVDVTVLKDALSTTVTVPPVTWDYVLPLPQIVTGKYLLLRSDKPFQAKINGSIAIAFLANKTNELWCDFTDVKVSNPDTALPLRLTWAIGGE